MAARQDDEQVEDHPIEQVRLTVPPTDDPTLPAFTFRVLVIGLSSCILASSLGMFFSFRRNPIAIELVFFQLLAIPAGRLMAATLPERLIRVPCTTWNFSLNPGPFNIKEHVLITTMAKGSYGTASDIIVTMKAFYHRPLNPWAALLLMLTTQMLGFGFAGMFKRFLVDSPYMWWPFVLMDVPFYRTLNEKESRPKGMQSRLQFLTSVFVLSFAYYIIPNYFFPSIGALSLACLFWKNSVIAHQLGSGLNGLGLGTFTFDWATISSFLGSPLALPISSIIQSMIGFIFLVYIITPISYWSNEFNSQRFPIISTGLYDENGQVYNLSRVLKDKSLEFRLDGYESYSKVYLSVTFAYQHAFYFAAFSATFVHVALFHGRDFWRQYKESKKGGTPDIHSEMMNKYDSVPQWWFHAIWIPTLGLSMLISEGFGKQLQLPFWGVLLAVFMVFIVILPLGAFEATTGLSISMDILLEMMIGYIYPGKPLANQAFNAYGTATIGSAFSFIKDFKRGQYLKIPPKSMFAAQVVGAIVSVFVQFGVTWWLFSSVKNICHADLLPKGSPWTCPISNKVSSVTSLWGIIGPAKVFYPNGVYSRLMISFAIGAIGPILIWIAAHVFPKKRWIYMIHFPNILLGGVDVPPVSTVNYWSWGFVGIVFNYLVYKKYKEWWSRYNYILSIALDAGMAAMALMTSLSLQMEGTYGVNWWGLEQSDHCPLATCPTAPNVKVEGCPLIH